MVSYFIENVNNTFYLYQEMFQPLRNHPTFKLLVFGSTMH